MVLGDKQGTPARNCALRNGFVSGVTRLQRSSARNEPPALLRGDDEMTSPLHVPDCCQAIRPAGTREALPGTKIEKS